MLSSLISNGAKRKPNQIRVNKDTKKMNTANTTIRMFDVNGAGPVLVNDEIRSYISGASKVSEADMYYGIHLAYNRIDSLQCALNNMKRLLAEPDPSAGIEPGLLKYRDEVEAHFAKGGEVEVSMKGENIWSTRSYWLISWLWEDYDYRIKSEVIDPEDVRRREVEKYYRNGLNVQRKHLTDGEKGWYHCDEPVHLWDWDKHDYRINALQKQEKQEPVKDSYTDADICTEYVNPPIPSRIWDWVAYLEDADEGEPHGWGATEEEAIESLKEILDEE